MAFGEPGATRPPQAALPAPDAKPMSYTWQVARGKLRGVGWDRALAIHDTTPTSTRFLSRWCGPFGEREVARLGKSASGPLGPGECGISAPFKEAAREV